MRKQIAIILLSSSSIAMAETAQTISEPWYERDRLSGNWAGERDSFEASGVAPFIVYDSILAANVSGGIKSDEALPGSYTPGSTWILKSYWTCRTRCSRFPWLTVTAR